MEEELEKKLRILKKERNRTRLTTEKGQPAKKKQKTNDTEYISIRNTWGPPPPPVAPKKNILEDKETVGSRPKKQRKE